MKKINIKNKAKHLLLWPALLTVATVNAMAYFHANKFTNYDNENLDRPDKSYELGLFDKLKTLLLGVNIPRPKGEIVPNQRFETVSLNSNKKLEAWSVKAKNPKGTVILFHGYSTDKSSMLDRSDVLHDLGYNTLLVDFMGSGGSEGNQTTIGFFEAEQVKSAFEYVKNRGDDNIYLYGTSMGAVAVMKAIHDFGLESSGVMLECPFGSMYETVDNRFKTMKAPSFPLAYLLVFWGGVQNGFWAFDHNPVDYAKKIKSPVLLMYGEKDLRVTRHEIDQIYSNIKTKKILKTYPESGHETYITMYKDRWTEDIKSFMDLRGCLKFI